MIESALSDFAGWFADLIENVGSIGLGYLILGCLLQWGQTLLNSVAWRNVLQASYPEKHILQKEISAGYAAGVGLNSVLPGQAGTITYLALFRASISGQASRRSPPVPPSRRSSGRSWAGSCTCCCSCLGRTRSTSSWGRSRRGSATTW